jgi:hypothetical protein
MRDWRGGSIEDAKMSAMIVDVGSNVFPLVKLFCFVATVSMGATFGIATVCRWMKWAPININVNSYRSDEEAAASSIWPRR